MNSEVACFYEMAEGDNKMSASSMMTSWLIVAYEHALGKEGDLASKASRGALKWRIRRVKPSELHGVGFLASFALTGGSKVRRQTDRVTLAWHFIDDRQLYFIYWVYTLPKIVCLFEYD